MEQFPALFGWLLARLTGRNVFFFTCNEKSSDQYYNLEKNLLKQITKKYIFFALVLTNTLTVANWIGTLSKSGSENFTQKQDSRCFKFHRSFFNSSSLSWISEELNSKGLYLIPQKKEEIVVMCFRPLWRWCYTRLFATTIFSTTERCNIVATLF